LVALEPEAEAEADWLLLSGFCGDDAGSSGVVVLYSVGVGDASAVLPIPLKRIHFLISLERVLLLMRLDSDRGAPERGQIFPWVESQFTICIEGIEGLIGI
jgi:hypothetical protein